jgi:hypothetical protein
MAAFANKTLWTESMADQAEEDRLFSHAQSMQAGGVAIRTVSGRLPGSIQRFHGAGMKVYAWRWPTVVPHAGGGRYAIDEANFVAQTLIPAGLDGYIVDPESEGDGASNDWNRTNLPIPAAQLATQFCQIIRTAAQAAHRNDFLLGLTSGGNYPATLTHLPWAEFVAGTDALFPQLYWRARNNHDVCKNVRDGTVGTAFDACLPSWHAIAQGKPIVAMAGEISCVSDLSQIAAFRQRATAENLSLLHFYTDDDDVTADLCAAIRNL